MLEVSIQSYKEHYTYLWHDDGKEYIKSNFNNNKLSEEISNPNSVFFLVQHDKKCVGLVKVNIDSKTVIYPATTALELERIYFIKESSGKGLGKMALNFIINFSRQKGKSILWLKAMSSSPAIGFYRKQEFVISGETFFDHPEIKREFRKMIILCKKL